MSKKKTPRPKREMEINTAVSQSVISQKQKPGRTWNFIPTFWSRHGLIILFFFFLWWLFGVRYKDLLYVVWQREGFYLEWETLTEAFVYISEPLNRLSSFFMQSFAFPLFGGLVIALIGTGIVCCLASKKAIGFAYAFVIPLFLLIVLTRQGYYVFCFRAFAFFFQLYLGLLIALSLVPVYRQRKTPFQRNLFALIVMILLYPIIGTIILCSGLYFIKVELDEGRLSTSSELELKQGTSYLVQHGKRAIGIALMILVVPFFWYLFYSARIPICMLYAHNFYYREIMLVDLATILMNHIYGSIFIVLLVLPVLASLFLFLKQYWHLKRTIRQEVPETIQESEKESITSVELPLLTEATRAASKPIPVGTILILILVPVFMIISVFTARHDAAFMTALAMVRPFEERNWEQIIEQEQKLKTTLLPLIELRRQAQLETGVLCDHYFERYYDYHISQELISTSSLRIYGLELMLLAGNINHAYRHAMNDFQFRRNESPLHLKILFFGALINEEYFLAERYLLRLEKTPFRKAWCYQWCQILERCRQNVSPKELDDSDEYKNILARILLIRALRPNQDYLGSDDLHFLPCVSYASQYRNMENLPRKYQEQILLHLLTIRNFKTFRSQLTLYYKDLKKLGIYELPEVFQQAVLYSIFAETLKITPSTEFPCSEKIMEQYKDYVKIMVAYSKTKDSRLQMELFEKYKNTCWFYFDFSSNFLYY